MRRNVFLFEEMLSACGFDLHVPDGVVLGTIVSDLFIWNVLLAIEHWLIEVVIKLFFVLEFDPVNALRNDWRLELRLVDAQTINELSSPVQVIDNFLDC